MTKGVLTLITIFLVMWVLIFCVLMWKHVYVKVPGVRKEARAKEKYHFSLAGVTSSLVVSKVIWSCIGVIMLVYALSLILPIFWMFYTSLKSNAAFVLDPFLIPGMYQPTPEDKELIKNWDAWQNLYNGWHWENYATALRRLKVNEGIKEYDVYDMLFNSIITSVWNPFKSIFWMTLTAYVIARCKFPGGKFLYNYGIVLMIVPIYGTGATSMIFMRELGLYDNLYVSMFVMQPSTTWSGMNFLILYGALKAIPLTYSEAAELDGASQLVIMFKIIIPMVLPTCATFYLLGFIGEWNSYESFLVMYPSFPNISYGVYRFEKTAGNGAEGLRTPEIFAGIVMVMIVPMILYLSFQKIIRSKFTVGGLKG